MPVSTDSQRRPLYIDRLNNRLLADPIGAGAWPRVQLALEVFGEFDANVLIGRYGTTGILGPLSADVTIQLINTATAQTINAARVVAGTTSGAGVLQLTDSTSSTSTTTAATPNAVKSAYDLATTAKNTADAITASALLKAGGTVTGPVVIGTAGSLQFEGATDDAFETTLSAIDPTADRAVSLPNGDTTLAGLSLTQTFLAAQRGAVTALTPGATVTPDFAASNHFSLTLGQNTVLANPTNQVAGQSGVIVITQNAATAYTISFGGNWKFSGGTPAMSTGLSSVSALAYFVESATRISASLLKDLV